MSSPASPLLSLSDAPFPTLPFDVLVAIRCEDAEGLDPRVSAAADAALASVNETRELRGKAYEVFWLPVSAAGWQARRLLIVGGGRQADLSNERVRRLAIAAGLAVRGRRLERLAFILPAGADSPAHVQAVAEGLVFASLDVDIYKTGEREVAPLTAAAIVVSAADEARKRALERGRILGLATNEARLLANEPSNKLTPRVFADRAASLAADAGLSVEVLDESAIEALQMGLLAGVGQGSVEPPRLIVMRHSPPGVTAGPVLGLVGKGITFDTGGISIKPAEMMDRMKNDMSGGAAVIAAMRAIAQLGAPIRVVGVVAAAENMPGGRAFKPGDVLRAASGKTVEVLNTDAEGRLVLGDALWYAREKAGATHLVDVATLTGACVIALGRVASGLFGTPDWWVERVRATADRAGDRVWPLPLYEEYAEQLKSDIADLVNVGGRPAGAITAAMFLKEFAGDVPWAHLDIAGTAWVDEPKPYQPKGATGVAVRTLAGLAFTGEPWEPGPTA
ncbi:MAG TPA: leucyl aminopeptidase [Vicinamibacterales bacterium]